MNIEEMRKILRSERAVVGTALTLKKLKREELERVYLSKNCPEDAESDIAHYSKIAKVEVEKLNILNDELGTLCKKPFSVSVVGLKK